MEMGYKTKKTGKEPGDKPGKKWDVTGRLLVESFLSTWAFLRIASMETSNFLLVVIFLLCVTFYKKVAELDDIRKDGPKSKYYVSYLISVIFTVFYIIGNFDLICKDLRNGLFLVSMTTIVTTGLLILFYKTILFFLLISRNLSVIAEKDGYDGVLLKHLPVISFFVCLLGWLPYFLMNYPGVMTPDSISQYAQIIGAYSQSNHHPWIHTQLLKLFYKIGLLFTDNHNIAISFYTIFQMCFMALGIAYLIATLKKFRIKKWILFITIAFYSLLPYEGMYVVTIWKDIIFAGGVLIYACSLLCLLSSDKFRIKDSIIFFLSGIIMCLFRTNGWYVFVLMIPFIMVIFRRNWKVVAGIQIITIVIVLLISGPIMTHFKVEQPDLIESLSIPSQQIARVIYDGKEITKEQHDYLNSILDINKVKVYYNPYNSGGFKRLVREGNQQFLQDHFNEFLSMWVKMGIAHPKEYLIAYRDQTMGYWSPFTDTTIGMNEGIIENEFGLASTNFIQSKGVSKGKEILFKLQDFVPLYGILWSSGALLWCTIVFMGILFINGKRRYLLIYLPNIGLFLTLMVATPLSREFRYAYALAFCFPLYAIVAFFKRDEDLKHSES